MTTPLTITPGKFYSTRDGHKVGIYATDGEGDLSIHGYIITGGGKAISSWNAVGLWGPNLVISSPLDIIAEWVDEPQGSWDGYPAWANGGNEMTISTITALARRLHHHYSQPGADVSRIIIDLGQIVEGLEQLAGRMIAPGHNPDRLTVEQVGDGWRLLEVGETEDETDQFWANLGSKWLPNAGWGARVDKDRSPYCVRRRIEPKQ